MRRNPRVLGILFIVCGLFLASNQAQGQVIFIDPCGMEIPQGEVRILRVWVCVEGAISNGIKGARFRIAGLPEGWITSVSPTPPAWSVGGDVFGSGIWLNLDYCSRGINQYLELHTIAIYAATDERDVRLMVMPIDPPLAEPFDCPFVFLCDQPVFTKVCCRGTGTWINGGSCPVAVEAKAWAEIKSLYR